ncbi:MAG TPA: hypothetical protein VHT75_14685 [Acidimicrobiales bacterium]|nr:hypothetical protein [Acidimicrobiales bacterium]
MPGEDDEDALTAAWAPDPDDRLAVDAAAARSRRHWLSQQAVESATIAGILLARAERGDEVTVCAGGGSHRGRLRSVTRALCVLEQPGGDIALIPTAAVTAVAGPEAVSDDRLPAAGPDLAGVLATLAGERPAVRLLLAEGTSVVGVLLGVGKDAVSLADGSTVATVRLSAIAACVLPDPGNDDYPGGP